MVDNLLEDKKGKTGATRMSGRLTRTVLLGSIAVAFGVYWLAQSYGVDTAVLFDYLKTSLAFVLFFALFGVLAGMLIWLIRTSRRR
jgi:apolipoprotein N-acyltransferase